MAFAVATSLSLSSPWPSGCANSSAPTNTCFRPAFTTRPRATKASPMAGEMQLMEKCEASTRPATVAAAKPLTVSSSAAIIPACRKPVYWPMSSSRHFMRSSACPSAAWVTSKPAQRLKAAERLMAWIVSSMGGVLSG